MPTILETRKYPMMRTSVTTPRTPSVDSELVPRSSVTSEPGSDLQPASSSNMLVATRYREIPTKYSRIQYP